MDLRMEKHAEIVAIFPHTCKTSKPINQTSYGDFLFVLLFLSPLILDNRSHLIKYMIRFLSQIPICNHWNNENIKIYK